MPSSRDLRRIAGAAAPPRRTPFARSAARAIATSGRWSKDPATSTSAASASSFASRSSNKNDAGAARASNCSTQFPRRARSSRQLDEYVIGQEHAKKVLAVAVHSHYKRLMLGAEGSDVEIDKSNILLLGPTGSARRCWPARWPGFSTCRSPSATPPR